MSAKKKRLGRGLDALLSGSTNDESDNESKPLSASDQLTTLPIEKLQRGQYQPRSYMDQDSLEELAESIKTQGIILPILVRPLDESANNHYEIIAGERRWRAAQLAQLEEVPVIIRDIPDEATLAVALIENIQRENLNPIEEAIGLKRLMDEFELTHQEVAEAVGKSRTTVTNLLRLISLSDEVKKLLEHGDLEMGHARALLTLDESEQRDLARQVIAKELSVRQTESLVRRLQQQTTKAVPTHKIDPDIKKLEESLAEQIGVPVALQHSAKGKGKLTLKYNSLDELDGILKHLNYQQ